MRVSGRGMPTSCNSAMTRSRAAALESPEQDKKLTLLIKTVKQLLAEKLIDDPCMIQLCMGIAYGAPDDPLTLMALVNQLPPGAVFSAFSIGRNQLPYAAMAALVGGNVRVGLEDNLFLDRGVLEVRAKSRRLHHALADKGGLGLIVIDYLQLMRHEGRVESRVEQVGQISRALKSLARELKVPVIALSQLSRNVEQRGGDKKPILSDLRESGQIEQDSDLVMFIYREEYYNRESTRPGEADIIIAKHRNGPIGERTLTFQSEFPKFMNYAAPQFAP